MNDIIKIDFESLNGKIFTYDIRLAQGDLTKINEHENKTLTDKIATLKCMKGIEP